MRENELDAALASAQRLSQGVVGTARVRPNGVAVDVSAGAPLMPGELWANLHLTLAPSENGLDIASARIGRLPLPPALVRLGLTFALDRVLGDGLGSAAIASIAAVRIAPPEVTVVGLDFDRLDGADFFDRLRSRALAAAGADARERVYHQLWFLDRKAGSGELPESGTMLPYLRQVVGLAADQATGDAREEARRALRSGALLRRPRLRRGDRGHDEAPHARGGQRLRGDDARRARRPEAPLRDFGRALCREQRPGELRHGRAQGAARQQFRRQRLQLRRHGRRSRRHALRRRVPRGARGPNGRRCSTRSTAKKRCPARRSTACPSGLDEAEFRSRYGDVDSAAYAAVVEDIPAGLSNSLPLYAERSTPSD